MTGNSPPSKEVQNVSHRRREKKSSSHIQHDPCMYVYIYICVCMLPTIHSSRCTHSKILLKLCGREDVMGQIGIPHTQDIIGVEKHNKDEQCVTDKKPPFVSQELPNSPTRTTRTTRTAATTRNNPGSFFAFGGGGGGGLPHLLLSLSVCLSLWRGGFWWQAKHLINSTMFSSYYYSASFLFSMLLGIIMSQMLGSLVLPWQDIAGASTTTSTTSSGSSDTMDMRMTMPYNNINNNNITNNITNNKNNNNCRRTSSSYNRVLTVVTIQDTATLHPLMILVVQQQQQEQHQE